MPFRIKFNWQQQSAKLGGWSTNFWINSDDLTFVKTKSLALLAKLNVITGAQVICPSYTISDISTFRNVENVETSGGSPGTPTPSTDADYPSTALAIKLTAAGNYNTVQWIRGIPDINISNSGRYTPVGAYAGKISSFFDELTASGNLWSVRNLNRATPKKVITALVLATGVVTCPAHGYGPTGTTLKVRVQGFKIPESANQIWRITVIDANSFQLNFWQVPTDTVVVGKNPTAREQVYILNQISTGRVVRASSHYTGRPTGLLGGRRRRRQTV
jgi:hypothetical protein